MGSVKLGQAQLMADSRRVTTATHGAADTPVPLNWAAKDRTQGLPVPMEAVKWAKARVKAVGNAAKIALDDLRRGVLDESEDKAATRWGPALPADGPQHPQRHLEGDETSVRTGRLHLS